MSFCMSQTVGVGEHKWIVRYVGVKVYVAAFEFNWILANKTLQLRVIKSRTVVIEPSPIVFPTGVLIRVAIGSAAERRFPKRLVDVFGLHRSGAIGNGDRRAESVCQEATRHAGNNVRPCNKLVNA